VIALRLLSCKLENLVLSKSRGLKIKFSGFLIASKLGYESLSLNVSSRNVGRGPGLASSGASQRAGLRDFVPAECSVPFRLLGHT
jgi:hypothetical protein